MVEEDATNEAEHTSVYKAMTALETKGWRKTTLNECVGEGYGMTVDDDTNGLPMLTPRMQSSLVQRLEPLDERFMRATVLPARHMPGAGDAWHYRLPHVLTESWKRMPSAWDFAQRRTSAAMCAVTNGAKVALSRGSSADFAREHCE